MLTTVVAKPSGMKSPYGFKNKPKGVQISTQILVIIRYNFIQRWNMKLHMAK